MNNIFQDRAINYWDQDSFRLAVSKTQLCDGKQYNMYNSVTEDSSFKKRCLKSKSNSIFPCTPQLLKKNKDPEIRIINDMILNRKCCNGTSTVRRENKEV